MDGKQIRSARKAAGLTQQELAKLAGMSYVSLNQFEGGKRQISLDNLQKLVQALRMDDSGMMSVDESVLIIAHKLESLARVLRDPKISVERKKGEFDAFIGANTRALRKASQSD